MDWFGGRSSRGRWRGGRAVFANARDGDRGPVRLLEHQAKALLGAQGISFSRAVVTRSPAEAGAAAMDVAHGGAVVLKAQLPFGGRGKSGAIFFAAKPEQVLAAAVELFGKEFKGHVVREVSVEPKVEFVREYYAGIAWDVGAKLP